MSFVSIKHSGFTLIELAMVLFVIALILGGMLGPLATQQEGQERRQTMIMLDGFRDNLLGYAIVNGHLPCPDCPNATQDDCVSIDAANSADIGDGEEDGMNGAAVGTRPNFTHCATLEGNLPWSTLGVTELDAWGNRFVYRVTDEFADNDPDGCSAATNPSFQICSSGDITVEDDDTPTPNTVASNVPALVISYGRNANDTGNPSSAFELENTDGDTLFKDKDYSKVAANEFDDLLIWITTNNLIYKMVQSEQLP